MLAGSNVGDVINLNRYRKRVQQQATRDLAERKTARSGRTKKERAQAKAEAQRQRDQLDAHRREPSTEPPAPDAAAGPDDVE
jgi:hypothetical protein